MFESVFACADGLFEWIGQVLELGKLACVSVPTQLSAFGGGIGGEWRGAGGWERSCKFTASIKDFFFELSGFGGWDSRFYP